VHPGSQLTGVRACTCLRAPRVHPQLQARAYPAKPAQMLAPSVEEIE
jgi:hypothetical protein